MKQIRKVKTDTRQTLKKKEHTHRKMIPQPKSPPFQSETEITSCRVVLPIEIRNKSFGLHNDKRTVRQRSALHPMYLPLQRKVPLKLSFVGILSYSQANPADPNDRLLASPNLNLN